MTVLVLSWCLGECNGSLFFAQRQHGLLRVFTRCRFRRSCNNEPPVSMRAPIGEDIITWGFGHDASNKGNSIRCSWTDLLP